MLLVRAFQISPELFNFGYYIDGHEYVKLLLSHIKGVIVEVVAQNTVFI